MAMGATRRTSLLGERRDEGGAKADALVRSGGARSGRPATARPTWLPLALALSVTAAVWVALFVLRVRAHQPNVDDYGYTFLSWALLNHTLSGIVTATLHTGTIAPLVPVLAAPLVDMGGVAGALGVELPLLLLLVVGAYVLARVWLRPNAAAVTALVVGLNQAVLGYALMLNFAVAATAATLWSLAAYLRSDHLRRWRWSLAFGVSVAALLLSRSLAPAYVVPLAVVVMVDLLIDATRRRGRPWWPLAAAMGLILVLAGPWWAISGHQALHYLTHAGYQSSSGFTTRGAALTPTTVINRAGATLGDLGRFESIALAAALLIGALVAVWRHRELKRARLGVPTMWAVLTFLLLSTSSNSGTGFGIPVLAVAIIVAAACLGQVSWRSFRAFAPIFLAVIGLGVAAEVAGGETNWWLGAPYLNQVLQSGGVRDTNIDQLNSQVLQSIGTQPTVLVRQDDLLNVNSLHWMGHTQPMNLIRIPHGPSGTQAAIGDLDRAQVLITGRTAASYSLYVDQRTIIAAAERDGFRPLRAWSISPSNNVVVWQRGLPANASHVNTPPPVTRLFRPIGGTVLKGSQFMSASATGRFGVTRVEFRVTGL